MFSLFKILAADDCKAEEGYTISRSLGCKCMSFCPLSIQCNSPSIDLIGEEQSASAKRAIKRVRTTIIGAISGCEVVVPITFD